MQQIKIDSTMALYSGMKETIKIKYFIVMSTFITYKCLQISHAYQGRELFDGNIFDKFGVFYVFLI
jgi:hypothetical protein